MQFEETFFLILFYFIKLFSFPAPGLVWGGFWRDFIREHILDVILASGKCLLIADLLICKR